MGRMGGCDWIEGWFYGGRDIEMMSLTGPPVRSPVVGSLRELSSVHTIYKQYFYKQYVYKHKCLHTHTVI